MPLHRSLENTLHGKVKPFITKCTLASILNTTDLQTSQRPDFLPPPTLLPLRHCSHSEVKVGEVLPEEECLLDLLGGSVTGNQQPKNKHHFVLATADESPVKHEKRGELGRARRPMSASTTEDIRTSAREIPGVPVIYVKRSVMILEELSAASLGVRRREEKDKFREGLLGMGSRKRKRDEEQDEGDDDKKKHTEAVTPALKKKKTPKVRGPNPLSVLKKKPKPKAHQAGAAADKPTLEALPDASTASTVATQPKAKRRRKHVKKRESDTGGTVDQHDNSGPQERLPHAEEG
jgi:U3 small nucleolar RNA-associated protein 23